MPVADHVLEIDSVSKRYEDVVALQDMSFDVRAGEILGFVGPNGAGKTTTMRIVLGVLAADSGIVRWRGRPITFADRRRIGYMPEERGLYPTMGVVEQLVYLGELHGMQRAEAHNAAFTWLETLGVPVAEGREIEHADERAAALGWLKRLRVSGRGGTALQKLSHGNQQRVQLAAALIHSPEALVLDEPFAGLDPVAVDVMSGVLRERAATGVGVLFSSHQLELVEQLCDRVGIIRNGRMVAFGAVDDLRRAGPERLWVDAPAAPRRWAEEIPDARLVRRDGTRVLLELRPDSDDQAILSAAMATGPVREFRRDVPSLTELFREVMTEAVAA